VLFRRTMDARGCSVFGVVWLQGMQWNGNLSEFLKFIRYEILSLIIFDKGYHSIASLLPTPNTASTSISI